MSMWDFFDDEEPEPYPQNAHNHQHHEHGDLYSRSSDYNEGYGEDVSHSDHNHSHESYSGHNHGSYESHSGHNHGSPGHGEHHHGHGYVERNESYSHRGQRLEASPSTSRQNHGLSHQSFAGHRGHQGQAHESYVSPSYSSDNTESTHFNYDMNAGYEIRQAHQPSPPPRPAVHGQETSSGDLFTSDSVVNLSWHEIDALACVRRSKAWLVVLYAPWCRFCQAMEPAFERVAQRLELKNVNVGRFRADGEHKEYAKRYLQLKHFPTVLFFPKNSSSIVKYGSENREVDALLGFVRAFE